jgi:hypothetical protein
MSEWETKNQGGTEAPDDDEQSGEPVGDPGEGGTDDESAPATSGDGWEETNDEPAQGEGGQEAV